MISTTVFAQNVYPTKTSNNQPLVYRDSTGNYSGCGVRTVFMTDVPKQTHMGDVSMNVFKASQGQLVGMAKAGYVYIPNINLIQGHTSEHNFVWKYLNTFKSTVSFF